MDVRYEEREREKQVCTENRRLERKGLGVGVGKAYEGGGFGTCEGSMVETCEGLVVKYALRGCWVWADMVDSWVLGSRLCPAWNDWGFGHYV